MSILYRFKLVRFFGPPVQNITVAFHRIPRRTDKSIYKSHIITNHTHIHLHTTILRLYELCLGQPGWAGTKRNIHPLTPIVVINRPLSASSIYYDPQHPTCSIHTPDNLFPQSLQVFQSLSSFCNTCPHNHNQFRCSTEIMPSPRSVIHTAVCMRCVWCTEAVCIALLGLGGRPPSVTVRPRWCIACTGLNRARCLPRVALTYPQRA